MRILHVITSLRTGGAEKLMLDLLSRFNEMGCVADLLLFDGTPTQFRDEAIRSGINIIDFGVGNSVYNPINILRLRRIISQYDIVHTHNTTPQFFTAIASLGKQVKTVTTEHSTSNRRRAWPIFSAIDRWMYRCYDAVICISDKALVNMTEFIGANLKNTIVINNGVNVKRFSNAIPSVELEKLAPGSRKILMVAGFRWEKDQDTVINALKLLPEQFHFFMVGDGVRRSELVALTTKHSLNPRVHFLGVRSDIPELLHAADYIVLSSHFEGLSLSSIEGMASGKPFIASDVDGLRDVVAGAGILFTHGDAKNLADSIMGLENDMEKYMQISEMCSSRAKLYDIEHMAEKYMAVYNTI